MPDTPDPIDPIDPNGRWITVNGQHIHVTAGNEIDAGGHPKLREALLRGGLAAKDTVATAPGDAYRTRDLHAEGDWPVRPARSDRPPVRRSYGGVIFDDDGRVLLRKPANHYGGLHWTFSQGGGKRGEHPLDVAHREAREETGHDVEVTGHIPGRYDDGWSDTYFYLMRSKGKTREPDWETSATRWATPEEARALLAESTYDVGRARDLALLDVALAAHAKAKRAAFARDRDYWNTVVDVCGLSASRLALFHLFDATPGVTRAAALAALDAARPI
jgi:8-oxo-dGTP diphosphatase